MKLGVVIVEENRWTTANLLGQPLAYWTIQVAQRCQKVDAVVVNSGVTLADPPAGALYVKRAAELGAADHRWTAWQHCSEEYQLAHPEADIEAIVDFDVMRPLKSTGDAQLAIDELERSGAEACMTVAPAPLSPYWDIVEFDYLGRLQPSKAPPHVALLSRADAPPSYWPGGITVVDCTALGHRSDLFDCSIAGVEVSADRAVCITTQHEFVMVEGLLRSRLRVRDEF